MKALIIGLVFAAVSVFLCIPGIVGWWDEVLTFLKGAAPVLAFFIGLLAIFVGIADIKDRIEAKKDAEAETAEENKE